MLPHQLIQRRLQQALVCVLPDADAETVLVRPCPDPKFGDYQTNALISLAKARKMNPRQLAGDVVSRLDVAEWCEAVEVAGAGFLNFRLRTVALERTLEAAARSEHLFFQKANQPRTIVVDFSSPNVAKPMHVGHIRSTILGDALARLMRLLGHRVVTDNHLGDWGTQFGKLIVGWKLHLDPAALQADPIAEMERLYKQVNAASESDIAVLEEARRELVKLQRGDAENLQIWRQMQALSQAQFDAIYGRLAVKFDYTLGESFYNPRLQGVVDELRAKGIARESEGAMAVFFEHDPELKDKPALVQKSDGGFNYTTTDLATIAYRLEKWEPDEIVYLTAAPQQHHFRQLFAVFRLWQPEVSIKLTHVWFGSVLGEDGTPFKTRSGETIRLSELLDEAAERALKVVSEKNPELALAQQKEIARVVGIGSVKYSDLLPNRTSDYVFSWDKMLALNGNTAPYLLYAYARIRSIFRRGASEGSGDRVQGDAPMNSKLENRNSKLETQVNLSAPQELALARHLLNFGLVLEAALADYKPNLICNYLYELAGRFTSFYENCPVLKSEPAQRASRLILCDLTGRVLTQGLNVLGIETLEQM